MNPRTTLVLAAIAALLGAFVWFHEIEGEAKRQAAADDEKRIHPGLAASDIDAISLETLDGRSARFERRDGRWQLVEPLEAAADAVAVDAIASALANLEREGTVSSPGALDEYGLGEDARVVRFEAGGETKGIRIGRATPVGGNLYVARLSDDEVDYVPTYRLNALNRDLTALRDRRVFDFEVGDVQTLAVSWPGGSVALERDEEGDWRMTSPVRTHADEGTLRDLLGDLTFLRAKGFVDEHDEGVDAAAAERAVELRWTLRGSEETPGASGEAWIGGAVGEDLLLSGPDGRLFTIDRARLEDFPREVSAYRDKTLSEYEVGRARRVRLDFARAGAGADAERTVVTATLDGGGWSSASARIDPERMSDLVRELAQLVADDVLADEMGESERASLGLAPPRVVVRIDTGGEAGADAPPLDAEAESDAPPLGEVAFGRLDEERGLFAQQPGRPTVYVIDGELAGELPISWEAFEADFVLPGDTEAGAADDAAASFEGVELDPLEDDPLGDPQRP